MDEYVAYTDKQLQHIEEKFEKMVFGQGFEVMIIDPKLTRRKTIVNSLVKAGVENILEAGKTAEAIPLLTKSSEDKFIFIVELTMPNADGINFLQTTFKEYPESICFLVADSFPPEKINAALNAGAIATYIRPVDVEELLLKALEKGFKV